MRILVLDKYAMRRDLAQMDMYFAMEEIFEITYATELTIYYLIKKGDYDILYLGIYHHVMNIDYDRVFSENKKPIIIDQADNEEKATQKLKYDQIKQKVLLARYLPNEAIEKAFNFKIELLPWYVNPNRFKPALKDIDVLFICSINGERIGNDRKQIASRLKGIFDKAELSYIIGEYYGNEYANILSRSWSMVVECGRKCLTQKYIEASLSSCAIIGDVPIYPDNELKVIPLNFDTLLFPKEMPDVKHNREYILRTFANKEVFLSNIKRIVNGMS